MRTATKFPATREIESLLLDGMLGAWSDDRLLSLFASETGARSQRAFAALVERHGPRVFRVCHALTGEITSAEDAFQATFLVLARKAGSLHVEDCLGSWLHGVAARVAASSRTQRARRSRHEASASHRGEPETCDPRNDPELAGILHLEIGRLPSSYRDAVYLCDIEGLDHETVALRLGCATGTIRSRLFRGRRILRNRLIRRGIAPAFLLASMAISAKASLTTRMIEMTTRNAAAVISTTASGTVPAAVMILSQEAMTTMLMTKIRMLAGALILGLSAATAVVFAQDGPKPADSPQPAAIRAADSIPDRTGEDAPPGDRKTQPDILDRVVESVVTGSIKPSSDREDITSLTDREILMELLTQKFHNIQIQTEVVTRKIEGPKVYPAVGLAEKVTTHYRSTIHYTWVDGDLSVPHVNVIDFEKSELRKVLARPIEENTITTRKKNARILVEPGGARSPYVVDESNAAETRRTEANRMSRNPARQVEEIGTGKVRSRDVINKTVEDAAERFRSRDVNTKPRDTESRLDEVERKLDRILNALEREKPDARPMGEKSDSTRVVN